MMAANGSNENANPNWPLATNPIQPPTAMPTARPAPSYSPADAMSQSMRIPKRRPLSTTAANGASQTSPDQIMLPVQGTNTSGGRQIPIRQASFEAGDDAYMRKPSQMSINWDLEHEHPAVQARAAVQQPQVLSGSEHLAAQPYATGDSQHPAVQPHHSAAQLRASGGPQLSSVPSRVANGSEHPAVHFPTVGGPEQPRTQPRVPSGSDYPAVQPYVAGGPQRPALQPRAASESDYLAVQQRAASGSAPVTQSIPYRQRQTVEVPPSTYEPQSATISSANGSAPNSRHTSGGSWMAGPAPAESHSPPPQPLQYHHQLVEGDANRRKSAESNVSSRHVRRVSADAPRIPSGHRLSPGPGQLLGASLSRPQSGHSSTSDGHARTLSPGRRSNGRTPSPNRHSPDNRPISYIDLLNVPYPQPPPAPSTLDKAHLRSSVGGSAHLLSQTKTLDMYRANIKKTNDPTISYEFAVFMVNAAQEQAAASGIDINSKPPTSPKLNKPSNSNIGPMDDPQATPAELLREARNILQKLSDRSFPFAQYYLGDGYASGLFNKGRPDDDRAFPLFSAASKHGHAEAGYRAALCYEFGWGCRKDFAKAVQYYRQSASKNHPGAMARLGRACLRGDLGLVNRHKEGLKWLKRAAESADFQYNSAPYELGLLHETGYGDDIFRDESYAAQLFTQSADLGHVEANFRLGDSYEHGQLSCPKDPALSVHFYTGAASRGHPVAMMALCAWYMIGAEPVLDKDENEAYQWARQAAECGLPKAEYAVGYFTEMGIGCRRDPLEANVWYVRAADQGDERAKHRIAAIRAAASGGGNVPPQRLASGGSAGGASGNGGGGEGKEKEGRKKWGIF